MNHDPTFDCLVIGGGVAGLTAARDLGRAGYSVLLLEARERLGGRVWSHQPAGWPQPIELGAEFLHGGSRSFEVVCRAAGLAPVPVPAVHWLITPQGRVRLDDAFERIDEVMRRIGPDFTGTFAAWLHAHAAALEPEDAELSRQFVEGFHAGPADRVSARTLFEAVQGGGDEQARPSGRYELLVGQLERELPPTHVQVRRQTCVHAVHWRARHVIVHGTDGSTWQARTLVSTLPLGVWKATPGETGAVRFEPPLAAKERTLAGITPGSARRVLLRLVDDVWERPVLPADLRARQGREFGFLHARETDFPTWWALAPAPILVGWAGGPKANDLLARPAAEVTARAVQALAQLLRLEPSAVASLVVEGQSHDWGTDPLTRGAYSFSTIGAEDAPTRLAAPVAETLFFAGEATGEATELGTVHGAFQSGERAAREVHAVLEKFAR